MSVAGLKYVRGGGASSSSSTAHETRSGSYIYGGNPESFHDWEFRTSMRFKLYEDSTTAKSKTRSALASEADEEASDPEEAEEEPTEAQADGQSGEARVDLESLSEAAAPKKKAKASSKTGSEAGDLDETTAYASKARTEMIHRVMEGLRDEAFELARDMGTEALTQPGCLRHFIAKMREVVFPRASEQARELFKAGQKPGALARQQGESMLSYTSRRRR